MPRIIETDDYFNDSLMNMIGNNQKLLTKYSNIEAQLEAGPLNGAFNDHPLTGFDVPLREFHLKPGKILIFYFEELDGIDTIIHLVIAGPHDFLDKTKPKQRINIRAKNRSIN